MCNQESFSIALKIFRLLIKKVIKIPPLISSDPHQDQTSVAKCKMPSPQNQ